MNESKTITLWERFDGKAKRWIYNHFAEGWDEDQNQPMAKGVTQESSWPNGTWRKKKATLDGGKVVE